MASSGKYLSYSFTAVNISPPPHHLLSNANPFPNKTKTKQKINCKVYWTSIKSYVCWVVARIFLATLASISGRYCSLVSSWEVDPRERELVPQQKHLVFQELLLEKKRRQQIKTLFLRCSLDAPQKVVWFIVQFVRWELLPCCFLQIHNSADFSSRTNFFHKFIPMPSRLHCQQKQHKKSIRINQH